MALATGWGLHLGADFIQKGTTKEIKQKRHIFIISIAFLVSVALGVWRANTYTEITTVNSQLSLTETNSITDSHFSAWPFIVISFVTFLLLSLLSSNIG